MNWTLNDSRYFVYFSFIYIALIFGHDHWYLRPALAVAFVQLGKWRGNNR